MAFWIAYKFSNIFSPPAKQCSNKWEIEGPIPATAEERMSSESAEDSYLLGKDTQVILGIKDAEKKKGGGPDGLRSWLVALNNFLINFIIVGLGRMSGILYIAFMAMYHVDRQTASMPFSIQQAARNLFGPLAGILGQKYGIRCVTIIGGILGTFSSAACYFFPDITCITIFWGLIFGICTAFTTTLNQIPIDRYFDKYRTTAGGVAFSGGCVATFIFPLVLERLIALYGMGRTFLVMAAFIFFVIPAALILVEPPWMKKQRKPEVNRNTYNTFPPPEQKRVDFEHLRKESELVFHLFVLTMDDAEFFSDAIWEVLGNFSNSQNLVKNLEDLYRSLQNAPSTKLSPTKKDIDRSVRTITATINGYPKQASTDVAIKVQDEVGSQNISVGKTYMDHPQSLFLATKLNQLCETNHKALLLYFPTNLHCELMKLIDSLKVLNDLRLEMDRLLKASDDKSSKLPPKFLDELTEFRRRLQEEKMAKQSNSFVQHLKTSMKLHAKPIFLLICLCRGVFMLTFIPLVTIVVDFAMDKGLTQSNSKYLIPILSLGDLLGRLCLGWINDSGFLTFPKFMLVGMMLLSCSTATLPLMHSEVSLVPAVLVFGMLQGSLFIRHQTLVTIYMEEHEQAIGMGFINFLSGFIGFALPFYIGYFRDVRGSYDDMFYLNAAVCALVGAMWCLEPLLTKNAKKDLS